MSAKEMITSILSSTKADVELKTVDNTSMTSFGSKRPLEERKAKQVLTLYGEQMPGYLSGYVDRNGETLFVTEQDTTVPVLTITVDKDQYSERHNVGCLALSTMVNCYEFLPAEVQLTSQTKVVVKGENDE